MGDLGMARERLTFDGLEGDLLAEYAQVVHGGVTGSRVSLREGVLARDCVREYGNLQFGMSVRRGVARAEVRARTSASDMPSPARRMGVKPTRGLMMVPVKALMGVSCGSR